ncbi:gluconate 2-dehydrogenase subunit 3 family protein [Hymenobacter bucti]|uniref:Gluconate 2-dehydrogenase subunit 3 family protein n=1 Tax=Hymenobacter bucti TaxID=1844114 RepID=A0ABW4QSV5_9BACT
MNRRIALKHVAWLAGAAAVLPGCLSQTKEQAQAAPPSPVAALTASQRQLVAEVCETIIPRTDTPGAKDLGLAQYVLKMLKDCTPAKEQQVFVAGLGHLDAAAQRQQGHSFVASTPPQRAALLLHLDQQPADFSADLGGFYRIVRQLAVDGYTNSKYFMTREVLYDLVPGRYNGHYPVSKVNLAVPHHGQS